MKNEVNNLMTIKTQVKISKNRNQFASMKIRCIECQLKAKVFKKISKAVTKTLKLGSLQEDIFRLKCEDYKEELQKLAKLKQKILAIQTIINKIRLPV